MNREELIANFRKAIEMALPIGGGNCPDKYQSPLYRLQQAFIDFLPKYEDGIYFRATNRKSEYEDIVGGKTIISRNHADGTKEDGMSVSESPAYAKNLNYKYIYKVSGDVVGNGSDGEPILQNCRVESELIETARFEDEVLRESSEMIRSLADEVGIQAERLVVFKHQRIFTNFQ